MIPLIPEITYNEWCQHYGVNRWYHVDGSARTLLPLDYNWQQLYDVVTAEADMHFHHYLIDDPYDFMERFYTAIPTAWLKYKTMVEMMLGTLDGNTIDPDMFTAGYTRETTSESARDVTQDTTTNNNTNISQTSTLNGSSATDYGKQVNNSNGLNRGLSYIQGVQGIEDINNDNIGELGNRYASNITDNVSKNESTADKHTDVTTSENRNTGSGNQADTGKSIGIIDSDANFHELVHETRINFYDNLAFLRDRLDRLDNIKPFWSYLENCFISVKGMCVNWW